MPSSAAVLALDIGGANLKAAHTQGQAILQPFELWKHPSDLAIVLNQLIARLPPFEILAVTMTGELCDCFETKRQGVNAILNAVEQSAASSRVLVWQTDGQLVGIAAARHQPLKTAAANWLALAEYAGRFLPKGAGLVMDTGSTTTDIVPLFNGKPIPKGRNDSERLTLGELVYTGIRRTPVCALLGGKGAAEWFATTHDVYLWLDDLTEDFEDMETPDGRPATKIGAFGRLARMIGADTESFSQEECHRLARDICRRQVDLISRAIKTVAPPSLAGVVIAGSGEFLLRRILHKDDLCATLPCISIKEKLGATISQSACAYALAVLTAERLYE